jgi:hypothetical protein
MKKWINDDSFHNDTAKYRRAYLKLVKKLYFLMFTNLVSSIININKPWFETLKEFFIRLKIVTYQQIVLLCDRRKSRALEAHCSNRIWSKIYERTLIPHSSSPRRRLSWRRNGKSQIHRRLVKNWIQTLVGFLERKLSEAFGFNSSSAKTTFNAI